MLKQGSRFKLACCIHHRYILIFLKYTFAHSYSMAWILSLKTTRVHKANSLPQSVLEYTFEHCKFHLLLCGITAFCIPMVFILENSTFVCRFSYVDGPLVWRRCNKMQTFSWEILMCGICHSEYNLKTFLSKIIIVASAR